ncbi:UbiH/UbiF family hydroxylase [Microvirga guangxiensis]|uniref:2-octaprenyl-6-methoxyphenol hydroxylase n=1 Tax=Microvirga guangxiensis TaxID=549386 RepID=A0A1G5IZA4_9HYPH|nr:UbiH/UbiF family hydroxylase [Microvirga guangxiensis]SCY81347.1 2-octaprenyl-6-methoxyphenol hydroxylase [Microvirga guangxiensis]
MSRKSYSIAVVGAGAVGLSAALAFARDGFETVLIGRLDTRRDGRTVALLNGSIRFLEALGVWPSLIPEAAPLQTMRIVDDTGSLFRPPPVSFSAREIDLDAFGWNIENATLVEELAESARAYENLTILTEQATDFRAEADRAVIVLADGSEVEVNLVVAADGRNSRLRQIAGIETQTWSYPQTALAVLLAHDREHRETSTEFHTRNGPFTLVPLPGKRSSLVWVTSQKRAEQLSKLDDQALALAVERQAQSHLGAMRVDGPRGLVPMSGLSVNRYGAPRLALVGEAAHVFPPIGAQGLNLGFRDVASLRDAVVDALDNGREPGSSETLRQYQLSRDLDVRLRTAAIDGLNRTLLTGLLPADLARGAGLLALSRIGFLRRAVMREGVLPHMGAPRLMQDASA